MVQVMVKIPIMILVVNHDSDPSQLVKSFKFCHWRLTGTKGILFFFDKNRDRKVKQVKKIIIDSEPT